MATTATLRWFPGDDVSIRFTLTPPTDITGWSLTFTVRNKPGGTTQFTKTVGSGIALTDTGRGIFTVTINSADTSSLASGDYEWSVKRTDAGSNVVLSHGYLYLDKE